MSSNRLPVNQMAHAVSSSDLERAREVQRRFLPIEHPITDRYETFGYNESSSLVGGDYFDYFRQRNRSIQCVIADACGHGMAAALIMSTFRGLLISEMRRGADLDSLFTQLNQLIFAEGGMIQYLTTVFLDFEEAENKLYYWNAGHFDPMLVHPDGTSSRLRGGGPPLGMFHGSTYDLGEGRVRPGDLLVLFTDGLVELRNQRDEFFGIPGILGAVTRNRHAPLGDLARAVLGEAAQFSQKTSLDDDLTLFFMRFR
jgi:sigma-B regulation protein RsbU (phosphoserine phosphatase)